MHSMALVSFFLTLLVTQALGFDKSAQTLTFGVSRIVVDPDTGRPFGDVTRPDDPETSTSRGLVASSEISPGCSAKFSIGANCGFDPTLEGAMRCDTTCKNIGVCHNGVFQMNSPCSPGRCEWREEAGQPFCV
ncbi:hypothetical protein DHEL01_v212810 [Diaporthe helianthi]|uniref:Uncharacterized protein n=1 Tax=Diaporthe helianthi TaxID=158607 RepID=A0A2P5HEW4_DIAHE|nr:hypothetical protein DHEL01_v212810 [Diaporthe helianthi]